MGATLASGDMVGGGSGRERLRLRKQAPILFSKELLLPSISMKYPCPRPRTLALPLLAPALAGRPPAPELICAPSSSSLIPPSLLATPLMSSCLQLGLVLYPFAYFTLPRSPASGQGD